MQSLTAKTLKGNWATLLLPIDAQDNILYEVLEEEVGYLIAAGVNGIYSNGTAGEFFNQTETEFDKINELLAQHCSRANMAFQIGVCHPSPITSLERIKRSKQLSPSAFQVILPDWVPTNPEEQLSFLRRVAEVAAPVPIVLYNPPHAKVVLRPQEYQRLSESIPELIGIKVADGNAEWYAEMRQGAASLAVFVPGHHLATGMKEGVGVGAYSNIACLHPVGAQRWYDLMQENLEEALRIERNIAAFFGQCILPYAQAGYSNPALDKFLAAVGGWAPIGTRLRWPYRGIPESEVASVSRVARQMLPEILVP